MCGAFYKYYCQILLSKCRSWLLPAEAASAVVDVHPAAAVPELLLLLQQGVALGAVQVRCCLLVTFQPLYIKDGWYIFHYIWNP